MRQLLLAAVLLALAAAPASAARPASANFPGLVTTQNIEVHFHTDGSDAVTTDQAQAVADAAEQALAKYATLGFPRPVDDGDGHIDIFYYAYAAANQHGLTSYEGTGATTTGYIQLNTLYDSPLQTIKHEVFHLVQQAIGRGRESWFSEATASWARWQVDDPPADNFQYEIGGNDNFSLNCDDSCQGFDGGYSSWLFFSEFDASFVHDVLDRIAALWAADKKTHGMDALLAELAERNLTLEGSFMDLGTKMVQGNLPYPNSKALLPSTDVTVSPPTTGAAAPAATVTTAHASLGFIALEQTGTDCAAVPLALDVQAPGGDVGVSYVQRGGTTTPLPAGATTVAWSPCTADPAMVVVANGSPTADNQAVTVIAHVVAPVLTGLSAPARTTRTAGKAFRLPVTVQSSAAGTLVATLSGGGPSVTVPLKAGANSVSLKVPATFTAKSATLKLTPSAGAYKGVAVSKKLVFTTKKKHKKKKHHHR